VLARWSFSPWFVPDGGFQVELAARSARAGASTSSSALCGPPLVERPRLRRRQVDAALGRRSPARSVRRLRPRRRLARREPRARGLVEDL